MYRAARSLVSFRTPPSLGQPSSKYMEIKRTGRSYCIHSSTTICVSICMYIYRHRYTTSHSMSGGSNLEQTWWLPKVMMGCHSTPYLGTLRYIRKQEKGLRTVVPKQV